MPSGRLRVGQCVVDVASREVHAPGAKRPLRLAPKSLAVLLTLARQPGQVVTREQLLAEVWPDTLPTNDVVTQAVTQLRKAFASHGGQRSEHIETIAKTGYRLMAAVVWEAHAPASATLPMRHLIRMRSSRLSHTQAWRRSPRSPILLHHPSAPRVVSLWRPSLRNRPLRRRPRRGNGARWRWQSPAWRCWSCWGLRHGPHGDVPRRLRPRKRLRSWAAPSGRIR
ncbi:hypothetical protein XACG117_1990028 [Xanthomonas citri pv. citri]|nr:hypothetical protein XACG117_1990028 [Xanthomonas citri pv. citri]